MIGVVKGAQPLKSKLEEEEEDGDEGVTQPMACRQEEEEAVVHRPGLPLSLGV